MASNESNIDEYDFTMEIDTPPEFLPVSPDEVSNSVLSLTEANSSSNSKIDSNSDSDNDKGEGWIHEDHGSGSSIGPFLSFSSTIIDLTNPTLELFFNELFDERMWTIIAEATNAYA